MTSVNSTSSTAASNMLRITGMATGLDTDSLVKAMTSNIQSKIDKATQDEQIAEWKQEMYQDIIKDAKGLQEYFDPLSDKYILGDSKFNPVEITNSSEGTVGITASSKAQAGNYNITVAKLAQSAVVENQAVSKADSTLSTKLTDINGSLNGKIITFNIKGNDVKIDLTTNPDMTIQGVLDKINNDSNITSAGVTASFDELSKKFVFTTNDTGSSENLQVKVSDNDSSADLVSSLGFTEGANYSDSGQNAEFTITYPDGRTESVTQQSNSFTANGVTYSLKSTGSASISIEKNNTDGIVDNVKKFIDDYNALVDKIQGKLTEKKQYTYKPLTDDQKEAMSDSDIEKWNEKAQQGLLRNDSNLEQLLSDLRGTFFNTVYSDKTDNKDTSVKNSYYMGTYGSNALGLDTSSDLDDYGKIQITDETKLKNAISNNIEDFTKFFIGTSSKELGEDEKYIGSDTYYEDGLFTRMDKILRNYVGDPGVGTDGTSSLKGTLNIYANKQYDYGISGYSSRNTLPDQIYEQALNITDLQTKLTDAEDRYYQKFSQLETTMSQLNSQMSSFYSQMGISQ
ncbi:flagellar filament capping protein FliD [Clostridium sp. LBM24168]